MSCDITYSVSEQCITENATPVTAFTINPPTGQFCRMIFSVLAISHDGISKMWSFEARVKNPIGDVSILGQLLGLVANGDLSAALWDCYLDAVDDELLFKVKGANNKNIKWHIEACGVGMAPPAAP